MNKKSAKKTPLAQNLDEQYKIYKRYYTKLQAGHKVLRGDAMRSGLMSKETFKKMMTLKYHTPAREDSPVYSESQAQKLIATNKARAKVSFDKISRFDYEWHLQNAARVKAGKKEISQTKFLEGKLKDIAYKQYHGTTFTRAQHRAANSKSKQLLKALNAGATLNQGDSFEAFIADYGPRYEAATGESRWNLLNLKSSNIFSKKLVSLYNQWLIAKGINDSYARAKAISTYVYGSEVI